MSRPSATSFASLSGKRRILLVDTYANKRDLRAKIMRKLGVEVTAPPTSRKLELWQADCTAWCWWMCEDSVNVQEFCSEIRSAKPPQAVAFLVGKPEYLAGAPERTRFWWSAKMMDTTPGGKPSPPCTQMLAAFAAALGIPGSILDCRGSNFE